MEREVDDGMEVPLGIITIGGQVRVEVQIQDKTLLISYVKMNIMNIDFIIV